MGIQLLIQTPFELALGDRLAYSSMRGRGFSVCKENQIAIGTTHLKTIVQAFRQCLEDQRVVSLTQEKYSKLIYNTAKVNQIIEKVNAKIDQNLLLKIADLFLFVITFGVLRLKYDRLVIPENKITVLREHPASPTQALSSRNEDPLEDQARNFLRLSLEEQKFFLRQIENLDRPLRLQMNLKAIVVALNICSQLSLPVARTQLQQSLIRFTGDPVSCGVRDVYIRLFAEIAFKTDLVMP